MWQPLWAPMTIASCGQSGKCQCVVPYWSRLAIARLASDWQLPYWALSWLRIQCLTVQLPEWPQLAIASLGPEWPNSAVYGAHRPLTFFTGKFWLTNRAKRGKEKGIWRRNEGKVVEGKEENINVTYHIKTNQLSPKTKTAIQICSSSSFANHQNDTFFTKIGQGNLSINKDSNFIMFFFIICCFLLVLSLNEASSQLVGWSQIMSFFLTFSFYYFILFCFILFFLSLLKPLEFVLGLPKRKKSPKVTLPTPEKYSS